MRENRLKKGSQHSFALNRRSSSGLLIHESGPRAANRTAVINLPVIQSMLRHAKPATTALYVHRVNAAQMSAQGKYLAAIKVVAAAV